jgi:hypothetical protein
MYTIIIEPMSPSVNGGMSQLFMESTYGKALSLFKELCNSMNLEYDTIDQDRYPCEWTAGGIGHDYRITLTPDNHA